MATELKQYNNLTEDQRNRIREMLTSGEYPIDSVIANEVGVSVSLIERLFIDDPEFAELHRQCERDMAQKIECASFKMALAGKNAVAMQKAQEFFLKKLMPNKYGDESTKKETQVGKRVNIVLNLPEVKVDENGIPVASSESPLRVKTIDIDPDAPRT